MVIFFPDRKSTRLNSSHVVISYAVSFYLQDAEKTLNDKQIDGIMARLQKNLEEKLGAQLR